MKTDIHPEWYPEARVVCACGNTWHIGATVEEIRTDICSNCHPYYTGEQRIVDTEGQVERFMKRLRAREEIRQDVEEQKEAQVAPDLPLDELDLSTRHLNALAEADIYTAQEFIDLLEEGGDDAALDVKGFGPKGLEDVKQALKMRGYDLPKQVAQA